MHLVLLAVAVVVIGFACSTSEQRREAREAQRKYTIPVAIVTIAAVLFVIFYRR